jgi:putative cardiolipin synthase
MGFLIDSPAIASNLSAALDRSEIFYRVTEGPDGAIQWQGTGPDGEAVTWLQEPGTSAIERGLVRLMGWLPIEWIL